ncbi:COR domain-containing protein [Streptomyces sp. NPDC089919]|uniref:COR domain-containing protein n=1 Tax=Streptomyces sp. NPDC089919 TaxID=3155188 RepID=UPI00343A61E4
METARESALRLIEECRRNESEALDIGRLGLEEVPEEIGALTELTRLYLNDNRLTRLPASIGRLTRLTTLRAEGNALTELPEEMAALTRLRFLNLSSNALVDLPASLSGLKRLTELDVSDNPLISPPPEIVAGGRSAILAFLAEQGRGSELQWTSKVLLVGQGRAGKTSLLKALRGEPFDRNEDSTHGLEVSRLRLPHPRLPAPGRGITMDLATWDFGGQEIYHATHQFFLTDRSLFLLLWDAQVGWQESKLYYWLDLIKARAPQAPVILVATHLDPRPADLPLSDIQADYPGVIVASMSADSATGQGVAAVRERIAVEAARLPLMGVRWPRTWLEAANAVRARPERYVTPAQMYEFMAAKDVTDPVHQHELALALHSLGDVLVYSDDEELKDLVVLHPQWLTSYISRVLDARQVRENDGVFTSEHRRELWADLDVALHQHFVSMMERFDLSYRTTSRHSSLVVELLPWEPPAYGPVWAEAQRRHRRVIRLKYRLHTIPPGIPTWFIAREHRFTTGLHWRSGALLRDHDGTHMGLVTVDRHAKTAEIAACGPYPHDFFAVLKSGFEQTLRRYPGLDVVRLVPCPGTPGGESCPHEFRYDQLVRRLALSPPRETVECPVHLADLDVRALLLGIGASAPDRVTELAFSLQRRVSELTSSLEGRLTGIETRGDDILDELREARIQQAAIAADQQRGFLASLRQRNSQQSAICPGIVSVQKVPRRRMLGLMPGHVLRLRLYCEAPGAWHRMPGDPYEVRATPDAELMLLSHAQRVLKVLRYAVPLVGPVLGVAAADLGEMLKDDIELTKAVLERLPQEPAPAPAGPDRADLRVTTQLHGDRHADYRALYTLLKDLDPAERWAGLDKVTTPEGDTYWLCKDHSLPYRRGSGVPVPDAFLLPGQQLPGRPAQQGPGRSGTA